MRYIFLLAISLCLVRCGTLKDSPKYQLGDGSYNFKERGGSYQKVVVTVEDDSVFIFESNGQTLLQPTFGRTQFFLTKSFDIDITTVLFKYRPARVNLPRQLNTDFNGNVFLGYRLDRFKMDYKKSPVGQKKHFYHRGITFGGFAGMGATAITPWTTNNTTTDEYSGPVLTRGLACMVGINTLTVGFGVGWDYLTDRDKKNWIYQNEPWYGLTLGLNLN